jgi:uncharacterized membrane protein YedE/YeeE
MSLLAVLVCGAMFGFGLAFSTLVRPEVVLNFLRFHDMGLLLALGSAVAVATLAYQMGPRLMQRPVLEVRFGTRPIVGRRDTLIGAAIFGIGWGLCGVCPGPAIAGLGAGNWPLLYALFGMFAGAYLQGCLATGALRAQPE